MQPLQALAEMHGIDRRGLKSLADSGLVPTSKIDAVKRGPVLMSVAALEPLLREMRESISGTRAAPRIGVHQMHLDELGRRGLLARVEGPVLKLLKSDAYYTRASVEALTQNIARQVKWRPPPDCVRLRVALRACNVRSVPWAGLVQAILEGRLEVFAIKSDKSRRSLADRLAVRDAADLSSLVAKEVSGKPSPAVEWIGNATASEILGVNGTVVWKLTKVGALKKHDEAPLYLHFKRSEVERFNGQMIFTAEIVRAGRFQTYRKASAWLRQRDIVARFELKSGGWKVYSRAEVEVELKRRIDEMPPTPAPPRRPKGPRHGPDSAQGKLAAVRELSEASRIGYGTAATILGATTFAVQKLAANGLLIASGKVTPFHRAEVEALAKRIVFVPEVMRLAGYVSYVGVMNWLVNAGIEPLLWLKVGGVPVFDRAVVEQHVSRPEFVRGAHPRWIKRKLLDMVERGNSVHQASIACGVAYATAKRWAGSETSTGQRRGARGQYSPSTKRKLLDLVERGESVRQASVACGVNYSTARRWGRTALAP
jgi:transposase-like protein